MQDLLEKILTILEVQDAKIKALEKELEAYGGGFETVLETVYDNAYEKDYGKRTSFKKLQTIGSSYKFLPTHCHHTRTGYLHRDVKATRLDERF